MPLWAHPEIEKRVSEVIQEINESLSSPEQSTSGPSFSLDSWTRPRPRHCRFAAGLWRGCSRPESRRCMNDQQGARRALVILAAHNLVQNSLLSERGYVTGNLAVSGLLVGVGRASGLSWDELGLHPGDVRRGLRMGARASAVGATVALLALCHPSIRALLRDERATPASGRAVWRRALLRFPLGTALFEEVAFRGVLPALLRQTHRSGSAEALSATAFGLWHLIPSGRALSGNPLGVGMPPGQRSAAILGGSAVAGVSGLALGWMRRRTGSLVAPWLVHTSVNSLSYLAGVAALRMQTSPTRRDERSSSRGTAKSIG
jgi:uncharacterized protein